MFDNGFNRFESFALTQILLSARNNSEPIFHGAIRRLFPSNTHAPRRLPKGHSPDRDPILIPLGFNRKRLINR